MTLQQSHLSGQNTSHAMTEKNDVGIRTLVRTKPFTEAIPSILDMLSTFVFWVDLCMHHMALRQSHSYNVVDVGGETLKARFVAHETMYVD